MSDLSPDGKHLIYFSMNGRWQSSVKGSWTAISRAPYLKAVSLFSKGDCWHGGGLFISSAKYWLNDGYGHEMQLEDKSLRRSDVYPWHEAYGGECPGVYFIRLQRDGWSMQCVSPDDQGGHFTLFEKRINNHWYLRKRAHATLQRSVGRGVYYDTHELFNARANLTIPLEKWEWAEVDGSRLVWASDGVLYAGRVKIKGLSGEKVLYDFNSMRFERRVAPY